MNHRLALFRLALRLNLLRMNTHKHHGRNGSKRRPDSELSHGLVPRPNLLMPTLWVLCESKRRLVLGNGLKRTWRRADTHKLVLLEQGHCDDSSGSS